MITFDNINDRSLQEIFDQAARHLLAQKAQAMDTNANGRPICVYRAPDGKMCAAGPFIPDRRYTPELEGLNIHSAVKRLGYDVDCDRLRLLLRLQEVHDSALPVEWRKHLRRVADEFDLNTDALKEFAQE